MRNENNLSDAEHVVIEHGAEGPVIRWFVRLRAASADRRPNTDHAATQRLPRFGRELHPA